MINKKALENLGEAISELKEIFTSYLFDKDSEALFLRGCFYVNLSVASLIYVFSLSFSEYDVKITSVISRDALNNSPNSAVLS